MASFDKAIPPGGEGKITLTVDTKGYEGNIFKTALVQTNDPEMAKFSLGVRVFVQVPVFVSPRIVYLRGRAGDMFTRTVKIEAGLEKPLNLQPDKFRLEGKLDFEVVEVDPGRSFLVRFTTISETPGDFSGFLNLKTNYEEKPVVNIPIRGRLTP